MIFSNRMTSTDYIVRRPAPPVYKCTTRWASFTLRSTCMFLFKPFYDSFQMDQEVGFREEWFAGPGLGKKWACPIKITISRQKCVYCFYISSWNRKWSVNRKGPLWYIFISKLYHSTLLCHICVWLKQVFRMIQSYKPPCSHILWEMVCCKDAL